MNKNFNSTYHNDQNEWIEDSIYATLAKAAEVLYKCNYSLAVETEMQKLIMIDKFVEENDTAESRLMLEQIFNRQH